MFVSCGNDMLFVADMMSQGHSHDGSEGAPGVVAPEMLHSVSGTAFFSPEGALLHMRKEKKQCGNVMGQ